MVVLDSNGTFSIYAIGCFAFELSDDFLTRGRRSSVDMLQTGQVFRGDVRATGKKRDQWRDQMQKGGLFKETFPKPSVQK